MCVVAHSLPLFVVILGHKYLITRSLHQTMRVIQRTCLTLDDDDYVGIGQGKIGAWRPIPDQWVQVMFRLDTSRLWNG